MKKKEYLIIAEMETKGYVLEIFQELEEAKSFAEYIFNKSHVFDDSEELASSKEIYVITAYSFHEPFIDPKGLQFEIGDGTFNVKVNEISRNFKISTFINERRQIKCVFSSEDDLEKMYKLEEDLKINLFKLWVG